MRSGEEEVRVLHERALPLSLPFFSMSTSYCILTTRVIGSILFALASLSCCYAHTQSNMCEYEKGYTSIYTYLATQKKKEMIKICVLQIYE